MSTVEYEPGWVSGHTSDYRISRPIGLQLGSQSVVGYRYIGLSGVAVVDYPVPDVQLDRSLAFDGSRTSGQYPGLDRFGRIVRHTWADGGIAAGSGGGAGYPTIPPIVSLGYQYDKASNIVEKYDARPGAKQALNRKYEYDELHRLVEAHRGQGHGQNFSRSTGSQQWNLGVIGNWSSFDTDLNGDGQYQSANDRIVAGSFNDVNEVSQLVQTLQGSQTTLGFTYDKAGSLREQRTSASSKLRFTHDAWNRLVKVEHINEASFPETISTRGEYEYNGLFQRVVKRADKDITDLNLGVDEQRLLYYSGAWQVVEERVDDNWSSGHTTDRIVQHVWGLRYIDDLVLNRQDSNADGDYIDSGDFTHYALTDHQFSVVALIDSAANIIERVSYTPYGEARHHWKQDVDGDGDIDATDQSAVTAALNNRIYQASYNVDADFNRDGLIDSNDSRQIGSGSFRAALPAGWISSLTTGNVIGFSGYVFNREIDAGGLYTVRFRHYDPVWGRWISRDPAGYADSMSLYAYGWGSPVRVFDPFGLKAWYDRWLDNAANFFAGVADSLSLGVTDLAREALGWNDVVDHEGGWYIAGEVVEIGVEIVATGGSAALRHAAVKKGKDVARKEANRMVARSGMRQEGHQVHHLNTIWGHPGAVGPGLFPTGGLRAWIHSGAWNLRLMTVAEHAVLHARLLRLERLLARAFNGPMILARVLMNIIRHIIWHHVNNQPVQQTAPAPSSPSNSISPGIGGHNGNGNNTSGQSTCGGPQASNHKYDVHLFSTCYVPSSKDIGNDRPRASVQEV